jgi:ketosteroid isomerase-like protein
MSRGNVELVAALQPRDIDLVELLVTGGITASPLLGDAGDEVLEPDMEVCWIAEPGADKIEGRGLVGFVEGWREWLEPYSSYRMETEEVLDAGDDVVTFVRVRARTARDDVTIDHEPAAVWKIRDGKVTAIHFYLHREHALAAAGLPADRARTGSAGSAPARRGPESRAGKALGS